MFKSWLKTLERSRCLPTQSHEPPSSRRGVDSWLAALHLLLKEKGIWQKPQRWIKASALCSVIPPSPPPPVGFQCKRWPWPYHWNPSSSWDVFLQLTSVPKTLSPGSIPFFFLLFFYTTVSLLLPISSSAPWQELSKAVCYCSQGIWVNKSGSSSGWPGLCVWRRQTSPSLALSLT